ncbi:unnamed protein product [Psylliodes chrysocephalus]|uniref:Uncharacterized protein n=1 Tax=Psylliodes chrysocephalus TaxID=3402493 RepID=A0A9P0CRN9_9CUCU|nr:unnamed protein product [Psylliodes chrysocephala]
MEMMKNVVGNTSDIPSNTLDFVDLQEAVLAVQDTYKLQEVSNGFPDNIANVSHVNTVTHILLLNMAKWNCSFIAELQRDFSFLKKVAGSLNCVKCDKCTAEFSVSHGGRSDVNDHLITAKHRSSEEAAASSSKITQFFKNYDGGDTELVIAAKEAIFAFHTAKHDLNLESLVVKIYKIFLHLYRTVTQLKEFCTLVNVEYKKLLSHGSTRFLSLLSVVEGILQIFDGLKSYFLSQDQCPLAIKKFCDDERGELYL